MNGRELHIVEEYSSVVYTDATGIGYGGYLWERFILKEGGQSLPANPIHVALYLTKLIDTGSSYSVIQSAFYGIKWAHTVQGLLDPTENESVANLLESSKRQPHKPKVKKEHVDSESIIELLMADNMQFQVHGEPQLSQEQIEELIQSIEKNAVDVPFMQEVPAVQPIVKTDRKNGVHAYDIKLCTNNLEGKY
ncbi:unnamed protein product [Mytilus coruscus]|uniref:Uncharacterized protein n=1 Tax=Mytilus coruscus TaxID=42192 RepID=A0A6J8DCB7_MYTCO|nr:unnamed protein product [Mytilus coruscus]